MDVPHVKREDYQLTDISDDNYLSLMNDGGDIREDLKVPDGELGNTLRADYESGKELLVIISFRNKCYFALDAPRIRKEKPNELILVHNSCHKQMNTFYNPT